ncbi:MAG: Fic family protein [Muribaculaceae bacterium]|nr:Fic family protein [Muribaculaceae bacterium]
MLDNLKNDLREILMRHREMGIYGQIDYEKFYLYSIITHSTAIEGSTVTEVEAQLLFEEGITSNKRSLIEQHMNLDLKKAYDYGREWIKEHGAITIDWLKKLSAMVMANTGNEYHTFGGDFSAARGDLRKLNVTAGVGGRSYMSYLKVPAKLQEFCDELNQRRKTIDVNDITAVYELSFWAHYELATIHPWADGNGRMSRLLMNLIQMEYDVLPSKVMKEDKAEYIQALVDAREDDNIELFINCMTEIHCRHMVRDINSYITSIGIKVVDKPAIVKEMVDKWSVKPVLADKMADILVFLADKDVSTSGAISQGVGIATTTVKRYLRQLINMGYVAKQGANKNRTYKIIK